MSNFIQHTMTHSDIQAYQDMLNSYFRHSFDKDEWTWDFCKLDKVGAFVEFRWRGDEPWESVNHAHVFDLCEILAVMPQQKYIDAQVVEHYAIGYDADGFFTASFILEWL